MCVKQISTFVCQMKDISIIYSGKPNITAPKNIILGTDY